MKRAEASRIAAERRAIAVDMRERGYTWQRIGEHLGVSAARACQIVTRSDRRRPGNPQSGKSDVPRGTTLAQLIERRARAVDECAAAHGVMR